MTAFHAGALPEVERDRLEHHLASCELCFEVVAALSTGDGGGAATATGAAPVLARGTALGRYLVLDRLGAGAMGVLYAAYDPELDRKIAVKLLRRYASEDDGHARLQREARALAKLSHPHVVTAYDVGQFRGRSFVAMELVDGETLTSWLASAPTVREIVRVLVEAGRGLAAAHAAGLVHRDFKPDNVLVGRDGRARVTDFGLAGLAGASLAAGSYVAGTPRYMAPEMQRGAPATPASDQFAFCVALWEALAGVHPYADDADRTRGPGPRPPRARMPAWIHAALVRGLAADPAARFPSMDDLLAAIERGDARPRRAAIGVVAIGGIATAVVVLVAGARHEDVRDPCGGGAARLAGVWDDARRDAVRRGLVASGAPNASSTADALARHLDRYTKTWVAGHRDACEAAEVRREQSPELRDRRMACLDLALRRVGALTTALASSSADAAHVALDTAHALPPLAQCEDVHALLALPGPPTAPAVRAWVREIERDLADVETRADLGALAPALQEAKQLAAQAVATGHGPLQAQALYTVGMLQKRNDGPASVTALRHAALRALATGNDVLAVRAWASVVNAQTNAATLADARASLEHLEATFERVRGPDVYLDVEVVQARADIAAAAGEWNVALELDRKAAELVEQAEGPDGPRLAAKLHNLTMSLFNQGQYDEALKVAERTAALRERHWGPQSPKLADTLNMLGAIRRARGDLAGARAAYERTLAIYEGSMGTQKTLYAQTLANLAIVLARSGEADAAIAAFGRAAQIQGAVSGPRSALRANVLSNFAGMLNELGRPAETLAAAREALAIRSEALGADHVMTALARINLGANLVAAGRPGEAVPELERARDTLERALGVRHPYVATAVIEVGSAYLAAGRLRDAKTAFERGRELLGTAPADSAERRRVEEGLAKVATVGSAPSRERRR